jgi:hypothetical protein
MLRQVLVVVAFACVWAGSVEVAAAQHQRSYEFDGTHVAVSIERFAGISFTDFEGPGGSETRARLLLNASEVVPTDYARLGFDVFIRRFSVGLGGGVTSEDTGVLAPRVGYLLGLTPTVGLWLRAGGFYAAHPDAQWVGITAEALFGWFPYDIFAFTFGPTLDLAFGTEDTTRDYVSIGIPQLGMSVWF